mgnify:FL=1
MGTSATIPVHKAKIGETYTTAGGRRVKILKIEGKGDTAVVTAELSGEKGEETQTLQVPGTQTVLRTSENGKGGDGGLPEEKTASEPPKKSAKAPSKTKAPAKEPAKPVAKAGSKKPAAPAPKKPAKAKTGTYAATLASYKKHWAKSPKEVHAELAEAKKADGKPPKLAVKWFVIEQLSQKPGTAADLTKRVREAYKFTEEKAKREVYRNIYLEGKRVTRTETDGPGKPTRYGYAK